MGSLLGLGQTASMLDKVKQSLPLGLRKDVKIRRAEVARRLGLSRYTFPALHQIDRRMLPRLPDRGIFLEVGANDGYSQSNTYHLGAVKGWGGILIEPLPSLYRRCLKVRPEAYCVNAACVASDEQVTVEMVDRDLMSVTLGQQDKDEEDERVAQDAEVVGVPARTLSSIIDDSPYSEIDFMSIDVEGAELQLLAGLDLDRHAPRWLVIETAHAREVQEALGHHMQWVEQLTHHDHLFKRSP